MALTTVRKGAASIAAIASRRLLDQTSIFQPRTATIVSKALRDQSFVRPVPYDYTETRYGMLHAIFDKTTHRFDDNSKIICVEGPLAAGKSKVAKEIAQELDMLYLPQPHLDMIYINEYGYDIRVVDHLMPAKMKSFSNDDFLKNPNDSRTVLLQMYMFKLKLKQYIRALAHVLSTGQGVVLDRSVYSDFVFQETLFKFGFIHSGAHKFYYELQSNIMHQLMRPHLIIYLDVPVDVTMQRIKERNMPNEKDSPFCTPEVMGHLESVYKQQFLKDIGSHAEIVVYDWSDIGDSEVIVEDLERIDFDNYELRSPMMKDWKLWDEWEWCHKRMEYTKYAWKFGRWLSIPLTCAPEVILYAEDGKQYVEALAKVPGEKYALGYNENEGDVAVLFKTKEQIYY